VGRFIDGVLLNQGRGFYDNLGIYDTENFGPVRKIQCNNCNSETNWFLEKITSWLMLLFIPLVPYKQDIF